MTRDECIAIIEGCEFRMFDAKITVQYGKGLHTFRVDEPHYLDDGLVRFLLRVTVPDRDNVTRTTQVQSIGSVPFEHMDAEGVRRYVHRQCVYLAEHEAYEHFYFEGKRIYDPHKSATM